MSLLTRTVMCDGKDKRLIYDFATKRFITYKLPKHISKWAAAIIALGAVTSASPYAYGRFIRSSSEYGTRMQPIKDRPDFWKIALIYLVVLAVCTLLGYLFVEKLLERAGIDNPNFTDNEQINEYFKEFAESQKNNLGIKPQIATPEFHKSVLKIIIFCSLFYLAVMSYGFYFIMIEKVIHEFLTLTILFLFGMVIILYLLIIFLERHIVKKKYNIKY